MNLCMSKKITLSTGRGMASLQPSLVCSVLGKHSDILHNPSSTSPKACPLGSRFGGNWLGGTYLPLRPEGKGRAAGNVQGTLAA